MKKKTITQSSEPVQHSHTAAPAAQPAVAPRSALPAPRSDTRLPIDPAQRAENRKLDTAAVVAALRDSLPAIARRASVVGAWVWLSFDAPPAPETRQAISQLGFHWNNTRQVWQHPCGRFTFGSKSDPRDNYASKPALEAFN
jgi:hypothetical protein